VENLCAKYVKDKGWRSIPPGVYFRILMIGYFEDIVSERAIAWLCVDSISLRSFLGCGTQEATPDHSSLTMWRQRLDLEVYHAFFERVLKLVDSKGLQDGSGLGVDATRVEANSAIRSIERKDTKESYREYVDRLAEEAREKAPLSASERETKGRRKWKGDVRARTEFHLNRQRRRREHGKALGRKQANLVERTFTHVCGTGGMRRFTARGIENGQKRYLIHALAYNLGVLVRTMYGFGNPRSSRERALLSYIVLWWLILLQSFYLTRSAQTPNRTTLSLENFEICCALPPLLIFTAQAKMVEWMKL
jgi:hypothetical protein